MGIIAFAIEASKLAILAIILFYVCEALGMPPIPKRVCQMLIILIAILASIQMTLAGTPAPSRSLSLPPISLGTTPTIIAPERR